MPDQWNYCQVRGSVSASNACSHKCHKILRLRTTNG